MANLETVTGDALDLTQRWMTHIREIMDLDMMTMTIRDKQNVSGLLIKLMRAATGMVKEARALAKDASQAARQMTFEDKRCLIVEFVGMMPPEQRAQMRAELGWAESA